MEKGTDDRFKRGLEMLERVYGPSDAPLDEMRDSPFIKYCTEEVLGEIWSRPHLSIRDRRLATIGLTATLGRPELLEIQFIGALHHGEMTEAQLEELVLHLAIYAGVGNGSVLWTSMRSAVKKFKAAQGKAVPVNVPKG
jgi:alkylhydroperoxidase/carboxymuconolactone decarboxylase family protein YurZ